MTPHSLASLIVVVLLISLPNGSALGIWGSVPLQGHNLYTSFPRGGSLFRREAVVREGTTSQASTSNATINSAGQDIELQNLQAYRMQQQTLLNLRGLFLSEALAQRGLPLPTLLEVATPEGSNPPQPVDWDCALATPEHPRSCLYSFDAEPYTKVMAPLGTTQWISLRALNRLRRTDPSKVEPMWHSKYAILDSWFPLASPYSILQHTGLQGLVLHELLKGPRLAMALATALVVATLVTWPIWEYLVHRLVVSGWFWKRWYQWSRLVHAALPLKLLVGQSLIKGLAAVFVELQAKVHDQLVDLECHILEDMVPLTIVEEDASELEEDAGSGTDESSY
eukprot:Nitzschia sp. Nitz4//scaffold175_size95217//89194//90207//NITZ4_004740-RA/size95217-processed-gene-0.61-mRNA-1//1//CDS//3329538990//5454//frame0